MVPNTVPNLKSVLKLYLETIGGGHRDGLTHTHQTNRGASPNTPSLSVEGYTKPTTELEINIDVKYVGEDERTDGLKGELARFGGNGKKVIISGNR